MSASNEPPATLASCPVCGDDYNQNHPHYCPVVTALEAQVAPLEGRSAADHMSYQSELETKVVKLSKQVAELEAEQQEATERWILADRKVAELEAENIKLEYTNRGLVEWAHKHNAELREMVVRMYQHCTIEKAEMTEAESDEWFTKADALLSTDRGEKL